ncbi:MAG: trypsin-like peptidase domain-containing protein, partial [Ignavibacteriales bacterium]|nr:trypsin-like peptidase domain-containing protein [Ignavibacteriales bacterium]
MQFSKKFLFINFLILFEILLFINLSSQNRSLSKGNPPSPCSICGGTDDRIPSFNNAIGRIVRGDVVVGTAWATKNNKFVTAGHCFENTNNLVLEFNVPNSTSGGVIQHSGDADRYTIDIGSIAKQDVRDWQGNPIEGKDWAVFSVYANSITGKYPIEQYGSYLKITRKNNPTNIRITGYGTDDGSSNYIQQTSVGSFSSYNVTNNALYYNTDTQGGNSGSPIIDEATGYAVGVHTQGYCPSFPNGGTSLSNSTFYNALGLVDITIDQYTASGSQMTGSTLNLWEGSSFIGYPILSSLFNFNKNSVQIFKASQSLYNSTEKFYNWGSSSQIINHNTFTIDGSTNTIASYFGLVASGDLTINSFLPETNVYRGNVEFKDPWLYDYQDAGYGNNYRNRGTNGIFYSYATPLVLNINTTTSGGIHYNGIFLNQSGPGQNWNPPYYTVHTTQTQSVNFGGSIGTRTCYFQNWSTTNATLQNANTNETPIVFTSSGAVVTANLKGHLISSVTTGLSTTSQRKIVADSYNYLHMVYESMGSVWYSRSTDAGATWSAEQKVNIAGSNAKCPSIACSNDGYDLIYITYQSDVDDLGWATPSILLAQYRLGSFRWRSLVDYISAYTYNANSVVTALNGYVFVIHKPTSSTAFTGKEFAINTSYNVSAVYSRGNVPNTDANSTSPSLTVYGSGGGKYYLAYQQGTTEVKYFGWGINSAYGSQESATISTGSGA